MPIVDVGRVAAIATTTLPDIGDADHPPSPQSPFAKDRDPSVHRMLRPWEIVDPERDPDRPQAMSFADYETAERMTARRWRSTWLS